MFRSPWLRQRVNVLKSLHNVVRQAHHERNEKAFMTLYHNDVILESIQGLNLIQVSTGFHKHYLK